MVDKQANHNGGSLCLFNLMLRKAATSRPAKRRLGCFSVTSVLCSVLGFSNHFDPIESRESFITSTGGEVTKASWFLVGLCFTAALLNSRMNPPLFASHSFSRTRIDGLSDGRGPRRRHCPSVQSTAALFRPRGGPPRPPEPRNKSPNCVPIALQKHAT